MERFGIAYVILKDFEGNVLVENTYDTGLDYLMGTKPIAGFCGLDDTYAYFYVWCKKDLSHSAVRGYTDYYSILAVALDGSGMQVLCTEEEHVEFGA